MKIIFNNDRELVNIIKEKLKENDGYCPCKLIHNTDNKCMCKEFKDMIKQGIQGECHCGLYIAQN